MPKNRKWSATEIELVENAVIAILDHKAQIDERVDFLAANAFVRLRTKDAVRRMLFRQLAKIRKDRLSKIADSAGLSKSHAF